MPFWREYFGVPQHISRYGIRPLGSKVDVIRQFPRPVTARKLCEFIGLINFYHRFVPHCADILRPLNAMLARTRPHQQLIWTDETAIAFQEIKATQPPSSIILYQQHRPVLSLMPQTQLWVQYYSNWLMTFGAQFRTSQRN